MEANRADEEKGNLTIKFCKDIKCTSDLSIYKVGSKCQISAKILEVAVIIQETCLTHAFGSVKSDTLRPIGILQWFRGFSFDFRGLLTDWKWALDA